jgi:hypothetical protein
LVGNGKHAPGSWLYLISIGIYEKFGSCNLKRMYLLCGPILMKGKDYIEERVK